MKIAISDIYNDERRTISFGRLRLWWPLPIAWLTSSSAARVFGWPVFGADAPGWVRWCHRRFSALHAAKWRLLHRYHPKHRYNIIRTGLEPGYYDEDTLILHGCMAMLERYIEGCEGADALERFNAELRDPATQDKNAPEGLQEEQADRQSEAVAIYRWWKVERPADEKRRDELMMALYSPSRMYTEPTEHPKLVSIQFREFEGDEVAMEKEFRRLERKVRDDEQTYLHRLIDIRPCLWT